MKPDVAIVGAGVAGLVCARVLVDAGHSVVLFDKGRKAGGRLSSRHVGASTFDHGAAMFTAASEPFGAVVQDWHRAGVVERWQGRFVTVDGDGARSAWSVDPWVGVPTMSALPRALAEGLDVRAPVRVGAIERDVRCWRLRGDDGTELGRFEVVLVNAPAGQAARLLPDPLSAASDVANASMEPCWAVMMRPAAPWSPGFDAARFEEGPVARAYAQASKPGRSEESGWVLHASAEWTRAHWDDERGAVIARLARSVGAPTTFAFVQAHRWRYASAGAGVPGGCLWDAATKVGACGDWCSGRGVEHAWRSGMAMARRVLQPC